MKNPYIGPEALAADCAIYGRRIEIEDLRDLLIAERIVVLYSPSGAGKTSLIQAGLLRELRGREGFRVSLIKGFRYGHGAGNRYLANLYMALEGALPDHLRQPRPALRADISLDAYLKSRPAVPEEGPLDAKGHILVFDQFEEVFTLDPLDREAKAKFFEELGKALKDRTRWALFSMREDHVAELDDYLHLLPTQLKTRFRLGLLDRAHARQAIEGPAREQGVAYAPTAADVLINDLCKVRRQISGESPEYELGNFVEPVQLQVVCYRLWERLFPHGVTPPATICEADVKELSVDNALEDFYAGKVKEAAAFANVPERDIREWVEGKLITAQGIRGQVLWEPDKSGGLPNTAIRCLENVHLVRSEVRGNQKWYELAHDRLVKPVTASNRTWMANNLAPLQRRTLEWLSRGKDRASSLSPIEWLRAWRWSRANRAAVRTSELDFLRHSLERIVFSFVFPLIAIIAVAAIGLLQVRNLVNAEIGHNNKVTSIAYETRIHVMQREMDKALFSAARMVNEYQAKETYIKIGAADTNSNLAAPVRDALITTLNRAANIRRLFMTGPTQAGAIAFHPSADGALIAYADRNNRIVLAHIAHGPVHVLSACSEDGKLLSLAFSPNGAFLAAGCDDGSVAIWTAANRQWIESSRWQAHEGRTQVIAFNRHSSQLASGSDDGRIMVMPIDVNGEATADKLVMLRTQSVQEMKTAPGDIRSLAFSPTEDKLAVGDGTHRLWLCDTSTKKECTPTGTRKDQRRQPRRSGTRAIAFSEDGSRVATGHESGELLMWEVGNHLKNRQEITRRTVPICCLAFINKNGKPHLAFGAEGLRHIELDSPSPERWPPRLANIDRVSALSLHAPTGLLAVIAADGYVAVIETTTQREHLANKFSLKKNRPEPCDTDSGTAAGPQSSIISGNSGDLIRLAFAGCKMLLLIEIDNRIPAAAKILQTIPAEKVAQGHLIGISASADGKRLATLGSDSSVKFWKMEKALTQDPTLPPLDARFFDPAKSSPSQKLQRIVLSPDGNWLVGVPGLQGDLLLVDLRAGASRKIQRISTPFNTIRALAFSTDGKLFAAAGPIRKQSRTMPDGVAAWRFAGNTAIRATDAPFLFKHLSWRARAAYDIAVLTNKSGKQHIVVGGNEGLINIWDAATGRQQEVHAEPGHADIVSQFVVSPTQSMFASADLYGNITHWDIDGDSWKMTVLTSNTGYENLQSEKTQVALLGFEAAGNFLLTRAGEEFTIWDLDIASMHRKVCAILGAEKYSNSRVTNVDVVKACS